MKGDEALFLSRRRLVGATRLSVVRGEGRLADESCWRCGKALKEVEMWVKVAMGVVQILVLLIGR